MEQRRSVRYPVNAPAIFRWEEAGRERRGGGFTRDMSAKGAYILCDPQARPGVGCGIRVQLMLPPIDSAADRVEFEADVIVVRTNTANEETGFAVSGDFGKNLDTDKVDPTTADKVQLD